MAAEKARQLSINQSMTKPLLILGCDRTLFLVGCLACLYVGFNVGISKGRIFVALLSAMAWFLINFALRLMGRADPLMFDVFKRYSQYSDKPFHNQFFFPAHSAAGTRTPPFMRKRWL
ncbi:MAG: VirB3 family type IV secretion system protein [Synergistaceae bacterium]|jgi:type IV secretory pathway TrbD component|nr:VirB3 family type IV secretion system protein [Synergistaceae bacterium]